MSERMIVSKERWHDMLCESRNLLIAAESAKRRGRKLEAEQLWSELAPLNRLIRAPWRLGVRGIDA